jgi:excisionase family DNA binding protein
MDEYLTVAQAAAELGISRRALLNRIEKGDVRAVRVNPRLWVVPRREVDRWKELGKLRPWGARKLREQNE